MPRMFQVFKDINDGAGPKKIECFHPQFFEVRLTEKMNKKPKKNYMRIRGFIDENTNTVRACKYFYIVYTM